MLDQAQPEKVLNCLRYILAMHGMENNRSKWVASILLAAKPPGFVKDLFVLGCLILSSSPSLSTNWHQTKRVPFASQPHKIAIAFVLVRTILNSFQKQKWHAALRRIPKGRAFRKVHRKVSFTPSAVQPTLLGKANGRAAAQSKLRRFASFFHRLLHRVEEFRGDQG